MKKKYDKNKALERMETLSLRVIGMIILLIIVVPILIVGTSKEQTAKIIQMPLQIESMDDDEVTFKFTKIKDIDKYGYRPVGLVFHRTAQDKEKEFVFEREELERGTSIAFNGVEEIAFKMDAEAFLNAILELDVFEETKVIEEGKVYSYPIHFSADTIFEVYNTDNGNVEGTYYTYESIKQDQRLTQVQKAELYAFYNMEIYQEFYEEE